MRPELTVVLAAALCACSSNDEPPREHVKLASLGFDVPASWKRTDVARRGVATAVWQPEDNDRKESITVIRSELSPAVAQAGAAGIEPYLAAAQRALPHVHPSRVKRFTTATGIEGARVELDFIPPGQHETYRRVHVVLVDGSSLVHVLYTAKQPDRAQTALRVVLDNLHHEEA